MKRNGFTLIELMVVIVIIGILAGVAVPKMFNMSDRAKYCETAKTKTETSMCATYISENYDMDKLREIVKAGRRWNPDKMSAEVTHTPSRNESTPQSTNKRSGYEVIDTKLVVFYSNDNIQLAKDISAYMTANGKRNMGKIVRDGNDKTGPIMEFDY